jgi:hypothetical protein
MEKRLNITNSIFKDGRGGGPVRPIRCPPCVRSGLTELSEHFMKMGRPMSKDEAIYGYQSSEDEDAGFRKRKKREESVPCIAFSFRRPSYSKPVQFVAAASTRLSEEPSEDEEEAAEDPFEDLNERFEKCTTPPPLPLNSWEDKSSAQDVPPPSFGSSKPSREATAADARARKDALKKLQGLDGTGGKVLKMMEKMGFKVPPPLWR